MLLTAWEMQAAAGCSAADFPRRLHGEATNHGQWPLPVAHSHKSTAGRACESAYHDREYGIRYPILDYPGPISRQCTNPHISSTAISADAGRKTCSRLQLMKQQSEALVSRLHAFKVFYPPHTLQHAVVRLPQRGVHRTQRRSLYSSDPTQDLPPRSCSGPLQCQVILSHSYASTAAPAGCRRRRRRRRGHAAYIPPTGTRKQRCALYCLLRTQSVLVELGVLGAPRGQVGGSVAPRRCTSAARRLT